MLKLQKMSVSRGGGELCVSRKPGLVSLFAAGALTAAVATAKADTVVWYSFDGLGNAGTHIADGDTVVNKANPGTLDATLYGMSGMNPKPESTAMPFVTNDIPDSVRIFDPVSGTVGSSEDSALYFPCGSSSSNGAMLEITNAPALHMQSFTVEAFVHLRVNSSGGSGGWEAIASQVSASAVQNTSDYAWYFGMHDNVDMKAMVLLFTNETYGASYTMTDHGFVFSDDKWHHVAFSVEPNASDSTHTDVKLYFDYVPKSSATFNFPIEFPTSADRPVQVGGDTIRNRLFQGTMSEFRISSGALTPDKFLRPRSADTDIDKDCVLYYDFEDLTEDWSWFGAPRGDVVNKAMPGIMDGTIVTNRNLAPEYVDDTPASRIRQTSHTAVYRSSEKSLCNYVEYPTEDGGSTTNRCGHVKCQPLDTAWFSKTNFTIETFFMTTNNVQRWAPFFMRKGGWNMQVQIGLSTGGGTVGYNITTNNFDKQTEVNVGSFTLGEWHHFALVVDQTGETKWLKAYLDNNLVSSRDISSGITQANLYGMDIFNGAWFFAGGAGTRSFDGEIDSMRITLRALEPSEFLSASKFPTGRTLAHVKFDDESLSADPEGGTMVAGINQKANDSGAIATFSDDVPGGIIRDGKDGEVVSLHNAKSLSFSGSKVSWGSSSDAYKDTYYIRNTLSGEKRTSWTVEFWMKSTAGHNQWSRILSATAAGGMSSLGYALSFFGSASNSNKLTLRGVANDPTVDSSVNVCDGKWHHIAFTYAPNKDYPESKSDVKFYIDYGSDEGGYTDSKTTDAAKAGLVTHPDTLMFVLGLGSDKNNTYNGLIDELRISDGALVPSQFLRAEKVPTGFMLFYR